LTNSQLLRLDLGVLLLHALLTGMFVILPLLLEEKLPVNHHWQIYLPVLVVAFAAALPLIVVAERYRLLKPMLIGAIGLLGLSQWGLGYVHHSLPGILAMLLVFFSAFTLLEASLPSLVSKIAPAAHKGTAMGIYSTAQFFGAFLGGVGGGWIHHHFSNETWFLVAVLLTFLWLLVALTMQAPRYLSSELVTLGKIDTQLANQLTACLMKVPGVAEVVVIVEEGVAYLKVDRKTLDLTALRKCPMMMNALLKS
jgi:MFS-type transporter involved in bile tolerance (Atg22 family)